MVPVFVLGLFVWPRKPFDNPKDIGICLLSSPNWYNTLHTFTEEEKLIPDDKGASLMVKSPRVAFSQRLRFLILFLLVTVNFV